MQISDVSANELRGLIETGQVSALESAEACLDQIAQRNDVLNAFLSIDADGAIEQAKAIDRRRASGQPVGPLAGIPVAIKDNVCTEGLCTTAGSQILRNHVPVYDATIVRRLKQADAIIVGKTNLDEFAMGSSTENPHFGPTRNPWNPTRVTGGSSGGSAASVAGLMTPLAIGSDTGGSIRQPASFCGLTGLKPSYGRVSRYGLIAFASSLDQIGPMGWSAEDVSLLMNSIAGTDDLDSTSSAETVPDFENAIQRPIANLKIGICREHFEAGLENGVRKVVETALNLMREMGAELVDVNLPHTRHGIAAYYIVAPCEASSNLARYDGVRYTLRKSNESLDAMYEETRSHFLGDEVKRRIILGTYALSSGYYDQYYLRASKVRRLIQQDYQAVFREVDVIAGPTCPTTAFRISEFEDDPMSLYLADVYTVSANLAGIPALSVPCGFDGNDLPVGLQLQGKMFDESTLLQIAHQYQQRTDWHRRRPSG